MWTDLRFFKEDLDRILLKLTLLRRNGVEVLPQSRDILNAYRYCSEANTKVVILGQDPYPTPGHAHGLAFSVQPNVRPLPKSLQNIFRELVADIGCGYPSNGSLIGWARQGVLLLNTSLTVEKGKPGSHKQLGWQPLIIETLERLSKNKDGVVFMLWGREAQQIAAKAVHDKERHLLIHSSHPSPYSAHMGFFGSKPFSLANMYLKLQGLPEINWDLNECQKNRAREIEQAQAKL